MSILRDPAAARARALRGKEHVRRNFLTPRLLRDWLVLFNRLLGNDTAGAEIATGRRAGIDADTAQADRRSNRAPVSYRLEDGRRVARRGRRRPRHRAPQPRLPARRDLDRERDDRRGPRRRGRGERERARGDGARRLALPAALRRHDPAAYDWYYNVVSNPTLWFIQHYLWDLAYEPVVDEGLHHAWAEGYVRRQPGVRRRDPVRARARARRDRLLPRLPPLPRAALRPGARHRTRRSRTSSTSRGRNRTVARAAGTDSPGGARGAARERHRLLPRGALVAELRALVRRLRRRRVDREDGARPRRPARPRQAHPISIDPAEFDELAVAEEVRAAEQELVAHRPEKLILRVDRTDLSKNIVRGFRAFEAYLDEHPEMHGRVDDARAPRPLAPGHPQLRRVPRPRSSARRAA